MLLFNWQRRSIGNRAFYRCRSLEYIDIPPYLETIKAETFSGCSSLSTFVIPNGVKNIEEHAFSGCSSLKTIVVPPSVTELTQSAFEYCNSLTSIDLPNTLTQIGLKAFGGENSLRAILLPENLESIADNAFYGCSNLTDLTSMATTPPECSTLAFLQTTPANCTLYVPAGTEEDYAQAQGWKEFKKIVGVDPDKLTTHGISKTLCDTNADGSVNSADVVRVYNYITTGK